MRTILCDCGWTCRKQLQEANNLFKRHKRIAHKDQTSIVPIGEFCSTQNGLGGITESKRGNIKFNPITLTGHGVSK